MVKNKLIVLGLIVMMLFSGCSVPFLGDDTKTSGFGSSSSSSSSSSDTKGVVLEFSEGNPPEEMYSEQTVTFGYVFKNHQNHEITDLKLKASGFETNYVHGLDDNVENIPEIPKMTDEMGIGIYAETNPPQVYLEDFGEKYNFNPEFKYCYSADSILTEQVCVPSKLTNVCEIKIEKMQKTNGPLTVIANNIINKDNGGKVRIFFTIENKGNGKVVNANNCPSTKDDYSADYDIKATLGTANGQCYSVSGDDKYKVINNEKGSFYCDFTRSSEDSYATQLSVTATYKYEQTTKLNILVKNINGGVN